MTLDQATEKLSEVARLTLVDDAPSEAIAKAERDLLARWRVQRSTRDRARRIWSFAVVATAAAAVIGGVWFASARIPASPTTHALTMHVEGAPAAGDYIRAQENGSPATVTFSDGTRVTVQPGASARIVERADSGAQIAVERGSIHCEVISAPHAKWLFKGGPFAVEVHGTTFDLSWSPESEDFTVDLREGSVTVRGPFGEGVALRSGQRLSANRTSVRIDPIAVTATDRTTDSAPSATVISSAPVEASASVNVAPAHPAANPSRPWARLVAEGKSGEVVRLAEASGIDAALSSRSESDLLALGDACRYEHRTDLARRTYTAIRARFAGTDGARDAAFFLGRTVESTSSIEAANWYSRYRSESPTGAYVGEALGREMVLREHSDSSLARSLAAQYLSRYPDGPFARSAATITHR